MNRLHLLIKKKIKLFIFTEYLLLQLLQTKKLFTIKIIFFSQAALEIICALLIIQFSDIIARVIQRKNYNIITKVGTFSRSLTKGCSLRYYLVLCYVN